MRLYITAAVLNLISQSSVDAFTTLPTRALLPNLKNRLYADSDPYAGLLDRMNSPDVPTVAETTNKVVTARKSIPTLHPPAAIPVETVSSVKQAVIATTADAIPSSASEVVQQTSEALKSIPQQSTAAETFTYNVNTAMEQAASSAAEVVQQASEALKSIPPFPESSVVTDPNRVPLFSDYLQSTFSSIKSGPPPDLTKSLTDPAKFDSAKRGLSIMQDNVTPFTESLESFYKSLDAQLHFKENAVWYVAGLGVLFATQQRQVGRDEAGETFKKELAEAQGRADEAVKAALEAAEDAQRAKTLALKMPSPSVRVPDGERILEESKIEQAVIEKEFMKIKMNSLTDEVAQLQSQLKEVLAIQAATAAAEAAKTHLEETVSKTKPKKTRSPTKKKVQKIEQVETVEKPKVVEPEVKATVKKIEKVEPVEKPKVVEPEVKATVKKIEKVEPVEKPKVVEPEVNTPKRKVQKIKNVAKMLEEEAATPAPKKKAQKVSKKVEKVEVVNHEAETIVAVNGVTEAKPAAPTTLKKKTQKVKIVEVVNGDTHPWSKLAPSTLSRKTAAELSTFLEERGVASTQDDGKKLLKRELVSAVQSCF